MTSDPLRVVQPDLYSGIAPEELREHARTARRRARRAHRPLRCSWSTGLGISVVLGQLVALLWLQGLALSARNRSYALDMQIATAQEGLSRTQKEIAALDSSPQLAGWAQARGWSLATQDKLDPVTHDFVAGQPAVTATAAPPAETETPRARAGGYRTRRAHVNVEVGGEHVTESSSKTRHRMSRDAQQREGDVP